MHNLGKNVKVTRVMTAQSAGTTDTLSSDILDMSGFEGVMFIAAFGTLSSGAVTALKAQQGAASNMSDAADLLGTAQSIADTNDNDCLILDIWRPQERYVRAQITRATANAVVDGIIAIQYGAREFPTVHDSATVAGSEYHASPSEGTA